MSMSVRTAVCALLLGVSAAQLPEDGWVVMATGSTGGLRVILAGNRNLLFPAAQTATMPFADVVHADSTGVFWYGTSEQATTHPLELFFAVTTPQRIVIEQRLTAGPVLAGPPAGVLLTGITRRHGELWFCCSNRAVGFVDAYVPGNVVRAPDLPAGRGQPGAIATDGREVFVAMWGGLPTNPNLFALDAETPGASWRPIASLHASGGSQPSQMTPGRDGELLVSDSDGNVRRVDPVTGAVGIVNSTRTFLLEGLGYNPWTAQLAVVAGAGSGPRPVAFLDWPPGVWRSESLTLPQSAVPTAMAAVCEPPFQRMGRGCAGVAGLEPRLQWRGLPQRAGTAVLQLQDAGQATFAVLALGLSAVVSTLGPLPLDGMAFGAPGCALRVSPDVALLVPVQNGAASLSLLLPNTPALARMTVHGQWLVPAAVNSAGTVVTEAVRMLLR